MVDKVKISSFQLALLIIGSTLGSVTIFNPASAAGADAWMVVILSLVSGIVLISIYSFISILNPGKTLIDILIDVFGKTTGKFIGILYLWYFIHLFSLAAGSFVDFSVSTIYITTPAAFIAIVFGILVVYRVKKGLEIIARFSELVIPIMMLIIILLFFVLISKYDVNNFLPVLEHGFKPVLKASFLMMTFPFGELVVYLMIFPHLNKQKNVIKIASISVVIAGLLLLLITVSTLMVLGPIMLERVKYPTFISAKFVPEIHMEVFTAINLIIGLAIMGSIIIYAVSMGVSQIFKLDDYKQFVTPITIIGYALSFWIFDNSFDHDIWLKEVYPYYALPFQVIIPIFVLITSLIKNKMKFSK